LSWTGSARLNSIMKILTKKPGNLMVCRASYSNAVAASGCKNATPRGR
jgi:hypothetical protein